jgi:hypothetical protein
MVIVMLEIPATDLFKFGLTLLFAVNIIFNFSLSLAFNEVYSQTGNANSNAEGTNPLRFSEPTNLTNNVRDSVYAQVASRGNNVYIVWQENQPSRVNDNSVNYDIFARKSVDGGLTFGKIINLSNNTGFSEHPQIAASGDNVYVAWIDNSPSTDRSQATENKKILFRKSMDEGNTFGETIILNDIQDVDSYNQELAAAGNNVYAVWQETPLSSPDLSNANSGNPYENTDNDSNGSSISSDKSSSISFIASADNGETFKKVKSLSNTAFKSYPKIAAYNNSVYMVWNVGIVGGTDDTDYRNNNMSNGIFFAKSLNKGNNFSSPIKLNAEWNSIGESQVAAYRKDVYVVWGGNPDDKVASNLFYTRSNDNGTNFSVARSLTDKDTLNVEVAADNNVAYIAWQGVLKDGNEEIFIKKSSDEGASFTSTSENISRNDGVSECTSITISEDTKKVYLAWEDSPAGNHEILFSAGG